MAKAQGGEKPFSRGGEMPPLNHPKKKTMQVCVFLTVSDLHSWTNDA